MNCLLVMPDMRSDDGFYPFATGICYISSALKTLQALNVVTLNLNQSQEPVLECLPHYIKKYNISMLLCGGLCTLYRQVKVVFETAKRFDKSIITVVGGGIISGDPLAAMQALEFADYGIISEGELAVCELCQSILEKKDISAVKGIIFRQSGAYIQTPPREDYFDIDSLACDYEAFNFTSYCEQSGEAGEDLHNVSLMSKKASLTIHTSRSCPFQCTFCFQPEGKCYRQKRLDVVFTELKELLKRYPVKNILFADETLGFSKKRLREVCNRLREYNVSFAACLRAQDIDRYTALMLKEAGCKKVLLGVESACNAILQSMKKQMTIEDVERAFSILSEVGIILRGNLIIGDPEETYESAIQTLEWYLKYAHFHLVVSPVYYYPGTPIYWNAIANGKIADRVQHVKGGGVGLINNTKMSDEIFLTLINCKIPAYRRKRLLKLPELRLDEYLLMGMRFTIAYTCIQCGYKTRMIQPIKPFIYCAHAPIECGCCGTLSRLPELCETFYLYKNIDFIIKKYGQLTLYTNGLRPELFFPLGMLENPCIQIAHMEECSYRGKRDNLANIMRQDSTKVEVEIIPQYRFNKISDRHASVSSHDVSHSNKTISFTHEALYFPFLMENKLN